MELYEIGVLAEEKCQKKILCQQSTCGRRNGGKYMSHVLKYFATSSMLSVSEFKKH